MQMIMFISIAFATMFIYRQGLKDGQKVSGGERIIDKPIKLFKSATDKEAEKLNQGIKNILEYGSEVKK